VADLKIDGINISPYKFFGNRGISFGYVSDRVKHLPHRRILDDSPDLWELGSAVPAHFAAVSEIVNYVAWIGRKYTSSADKRKQVVSGMERIALQERALMHRMLYGGDGKSGLQAIQGVSTFFDYSNLADRDFIIPMAFNNIGCTQAVREYEKRGIIVYDRMASSVFSKRIVEEFGLEGLIRVSPLHCNTAAEIDTFIEVTKEIASL
jgi:cysteine desulfurase/selenocysteine lyase